MEIEVLDQVLIIKEYKTDIYHFRENDIHVVMAKNHHEEVLLEFIFGQHAISRWIPLGCVRFYKKGLKLNDIHVGQQLRSIQSYENDIQRGDIVTIKEIKGDGELCYFYSTEEQTYWLRNFELVEEPIATCCCDIMSLMQRGCTCGQMEREKCHS